MKLKSLLNWKGIFSSNGEKPEYARESHPGTHYYSASERALIRQHRTEARDRARAVARASGITIDPRLANARHVRAAN